MEKKVKVVLDGTLFAECQMRGANRDGMMRVAEDLTDRLINENDLDILFASTINIEMYDRCLKLFIASEYPAYHKKIYSRNPFLLTNILKYKDLFRTKLANFPLSFYFKEFNEKDLFHSFYYPFSKSVLRNNIKRSITFHDIIPLKRPGYPVDLIQRTKKVIECIKDDHAISVSEFSRQDLLDYDRGIDPAKIITVPLAASKKIFYPNKNKAEWVRVKKKYSLPENYFLCISGNDNRKNVLHTLNSFNKFLLQEKHSDLYLVLAGNGSHSHTLLDELNITPSIKNRIIIPSGFIDTTDLASLYSNAICFFFMSLYEGFGLPALEAMQCGVPVVTSNTTSLPEVVGNGGIQLSPIDADELCQIMSRIYNDGELRKQYSAAALERSALFSWQKTADAYTLFFKNITGIK